MAKTLAVKQLEALQRLQSRQEARERNRDEMVAQRKEWEGQRGISAERKKQRDDHIDSCNADIGRRHQEIQKLQNIVSNNRRY